MKRFGLQIAVYLLLCFMVFILKTPIIEEEKQSKAIECPLWSPESRIVSDPKYVLDPEKFLTAFVSRGPNNQIYSLRETIYIAITLNRTLILPPFFKHDRGDPTSNGSNTAIVDFEQRIDVEKLRELIPVLLTSEARNKCPDGIEKIFRAQNICIFKENPPRLAATQEAMNLPIIFDKQNICDDKSKASEVIPDKETIDKVLEVFKKDKALAIRRVLRVNDPERMKKLFAEGKETRCAALDEGL
jgi:hypothetical protein